MSATLPEIVNLACEGGDDELGFYDGDCDGVGSVLVRNAETGARFVVCADCDDVRRALIADAWNDRIAHR